MNQDLEYKRQLQEARKKEAAKKARVTARNTSKKYNTGKNKGLARKTIDDAKNLAKSTTPWGLLSLLTQASPFCDWMYGLALFAAIFKDIMDLIEASGIGYILVVILTFCASIFIGLMMLLGSFSTGQGRTQHKILKNYLILIGGTAAELLFGLNILPIETITVLIIYGLVLSERKQIQAERKNWLPYPYDDILTDRAADDYAKKER